MDIYIESSSYFMYLLCLYFIILYLAIVNIMGHIVSFQYMQTMCNEYIQWYWSHREKRCILYMNIKVSLWLLNCQINLRSSSSKSYSNIMELKVIYFGKIKCIWLFWLLYHITGDFILHSREDIPWTFKNRNDN